MSLKFFTPIRYNLPHKTFCQSLLEKVDGFFYFGGRVATVTHIKNNQEKAILNTPKTTFLSLLARVGKAAACLTIVTPLVMLIAKAILRSTHHFQLIDTRKKLEKGINIPESTIQKIQKLLPQISTRKDDPELIWFSRGNNLVFKLPEEPNLVFKMAPPCNSKANESIEKRYACMLKAKEVCLTHQLGLLVIPHAKKFTVAGHTLIAEETLDFNPKESAQKEYYQKFSRELNETARQISTFIAKTGFNDVTWRNIPIMNEQDDFQGPRRIALIDLENMENAAHGFTGDPNQSCGLIRCVSEEQIDLVISEARKQGIAISDREVQQLKKIRLDQIADEKQREQFHKAKGIVTGREPIAVDIDSLGLDLDTEGKIQVITDDPAHPWKEVPVTLRRVTEDVIKEINQSIQNASDLESVQGKRNVLLSRNEEPFRYYSQLGFSMDSNTLWLDRIIQALINKGHIYKLADNNGYGYHIQA
jgi:hypothetical protein